MNKNKISYPTVLNFGKVATVGDQKSRTMRNIVEKKS